MKRLLDLFQDAKTFGSLIRIPEDVCDNLYSFSEGVQTVIDEGDILIKYSAEQIKPFLRLVQVLSKKYDCVITNPPYMGGKGMNPRLKTFLKDHYADVKSDLFSAFIVRNTELALQKGQLGFMSPFVWMFISTHEKLRNFLINQKTISSLIQLEYSGFDGATVPICTFTFENKHSCYFKGGYVRLSDFRGAENQGPKTLEAIKNPDCGWFYCASADDFKKIPGSPIAYWVSNKVADNCVRCEKMESFADIKTGMQTGDNQSFLRLWAEVSANSINPPGNDLGDKRWNLYSKGGDFRRWFGNVEHIVDWKDDGYAIKNMVVNGSLRSRVREISNYFRRAASWSFVSSSYFGCRYKEAGVFFDVAGSCALEKELPIEKVLGFLCSKLSTVFLNGLNPTLNFQIQDISNLPYLPIDSDINEVSQLVTISKQDWDSHENSWGFTVLQLLHPDFHHSRLKATYSQVRTHWMEMTLEMQRLEQENNRIFIEAYGLEDEITPDVPIKEITLTCNPHYRYGGNKSEEELEASLQTDTMKELISYSIGCMMGRYSLDEPGLIYAHCENEGFAPSKYKTFPADDDGIIPIMDAPWFDDDASNRFVEFLKVAWSPETLDENLKFVADSLGAKKNQLPTDTIRDYLSKTFFKDHLKTYKKRPIYWLFSSGKQKAFECLVYLHRYNESTLSRMRSSYVTPLQGKFNGRMEFLKNEIASASTASAQKKAQKELDTLKKKQAELAKFDEELRHYADKRISLDLDDGVKVNYGKFGNLLAETKAVTGE